MSLSISEKGPPEKGTGQVLTLGPRRFLFVPVVHTPEIIKEDAKTRRMNVGYQINMSVSGLTDRVLLLDFLTLVDPVDLRFLIDHASAGLPVIYRTVGSSLELATSPSNFLFSETPKLSN